MSPVVARYIQGPADSASSSSWTLPTDTSAPSATVQSGQTTDIPSTSNGDGIALETKIGLSIIPIVVFLCALWLLFLLWMRKRQTCREIEPMAAKRISRMAQSSRGASIDAHRMSGKICHMAAHSTPVHDGTGGESRVVGRGRLRIQTDMSHYRQVMQFEATGSRFANNEGVETELDSPIDRRSPFRLQRGDTVMRRDSGSIRSSLESELSGPWPIPPPAALVNERYSSSPLSRRASLSRPRSLDGIC